MSHSVSEEPYIIYCDFCYTCVKWWHLQEIFSFFKILIFGSSRGVKGKKWPKITSFSMFGSISLFFKKQRNIVNINIILFFIDPLEQFLGGAPTSICHFFLFIRRPPYLRNRASSNHNFWYTYLCKMIISLGVFFIF